VATSKDQFMQAAIAAISNYPTIAALAQAGDPRVLAQLEANATMLALLSQQLELAELEPFLKARDGTVLADASLKGVLPLAKSAAVTITLANRGPAAVAIAAGRKLRDSVGRAYLIDAGGTVPAGGTLTLTATQREVRTFQHTVSGSQPFYEVAIPPSPSGAQLVGIEVADGVGTYRYTPEFVNVQPGERVFHVETDPYRRLMARFGAAEVSGAVSGFQPANGTVITFTLTECEGEVQLVAGERFTLDYIGSAAESLIDLTLASVESTGADPLSTDVLRLLTQYSAAFDHNAVYLGDFDFNLRRYLPGLEFLSVWNEQIEERVRGASVANINKLFVAFKLPSQIDSVTIGQITDRIAAMDSSYKVQIVQRADVPVPMTVSARVSVVHDTGQVQAQIRDALLAEYGAGSWRVSKGGVDPFRVQDIYQLLRERVPALQDSISDLTVSFGATPAPLPEQFRFLSAGSLTVTITPVQQRVGLWNQ
jgi:hypothetical protein